MHNEQNQIRRYLYMETKIQYLYLADTLRYYRHKRIYSGYNGSIDISLEFL
jgi:hypothetical protein